MDIITLTLTIIGAATMAASIIRLVDKLEGRA